MKVFATQERNEDFAVDMRLEDEVLHVLCRHALPAVNIDGESNMSESVVEIRGDWLIHGEVLLDEAINLSQLRNMPDFHDHAAFCFYRPIGIRKEEVSSVHKQPVNLFMMTSSSKMTGPQFHDNVSGLHPFINVLIPFKDSLFEDWMIGLNVYDPKLDEVSGDLQIFPCAGLDVVRRLELPEVRFQQSQATSSPDGTVEICFYLSDADGQPITGHDAEVYLDTTGGALSLYRVMTQGGRGRTLFRALDLQVGEAAKIKCGFKYFSGTDDCFVKVV